MSKKLLNLGCGRRYHPSWVNLDDVACSTGRLLAQAGFHDVSVCPAHQSLIPDFNTYCFDIEPDGSVRKPDSCSWRPHGRVRCKIPGTYAAEVSRGPLDEDCATSGHWECLILRPQRNRTREVSDRFLGCGARPFRTVSVSRCIITKTPRNLSLACESGMRGGKVAYFVAMIPEAYIMKNMCLPDAILEMRL